MADLFIMAFGNHDMDLLDKAKMLPDLHYLDNEVQSLGRKLSFLFEGSESYLPVPAEPIVANGGSLKPQYSSAGEGALGKSPADVVDDKKLEDSRNVVQEEDEVDFNEFSLDSLKIDEEEEEEENMENIGNPSQVQEEEDEVDLS
jgi:hypothetical protein